MNFKKVFSSFPIIDVQFNYVSIDVIAIGQGADLFYSPYLNYLMINETTHKVEAGFVLQTGAMCSTYLELAEFVYDIASTGFFLPTLINSGDVYNEAMELITTLEWDTYLDKLQFENKDTLDEGDLTRIKRAKPTIH